MKNQSVYKEYDFTLTDYLTQEEERECRRKYNLQNLLINSYKFPENYYKDDKGEGDEIGSVYMDRATDEMKKRAKLALEEYRKKRGIKELGYNYYNLKEKELLVFAEGLFSQKNIKGVRIVEFTNASNGYPIYRIDFYKKGKETPKAKYAKKKIRNINCYYEYY